MGHASGVRVVDQAEEAEAGEGPLRSDQQFCRQGVLGDECMESVGKEKKKPASTCCGLEQRAGALSGMPGNGQKGRGRGSRAGVTGRWR